MPPEPQAPVKCRNLRDVVLGRFLEIVAVILMASFSIARAGSVTLAWDASPSSSASGYKVYYPTSSGAPSPFVDVGNATTATIPNLNDSTTYYFSVSAYNNGGHESQRSNEIAYTTPSRPPDTYTLTVNGGSGGGPYPAGTWVPVSAYPPDPGEEFAYWEGDTSILQTPPTNADNQAFILPRATTITAVYSALPGGDQGTGLRAQYYNDSTSAAYPLTNPFVGSPVLTRTDSTLDFSWGTGSPGSQVNWNFFSVKWTGQIKAPVSGNYTFTVTADDGVRLFINGPRVINAWTDQGATSYTYTTTLNAGTMYNIELHYYEHEGTAQCRLRWSYPGQSTQVIPASQLFPN